MGVPLHGRMLTASTSLGNPTLKRARIPDIGLTDNRCGRTLPFMKSARPSFNRWTVISCLALVAIAAPMWSSALPEQRPLRTGDNFGGEREYDWDTYLPAVFADAHQAIRLLRSKAADLKLDPNKIGICGFSAGGNLAFNTVFRPEPETQAERISAEPNFAGLFYPWFREDFAEMVANKKVIPPLFIMNAIDDQVTPVDRCLEFYQAVLKAGGRAELRLFSKGGHGFDLGEGRGESAALWMESFVGWLQDTGFIP